jgi:hypothetical protein
MIGANYRGIVQHPCQYNISGLLTDLTAQSFVTFELRPEALHLLCERGPTPIESFLQNAVMLLSV